ncbi:SIS domain-containing protein [Paenibacillus albicereus]|uniref:SIS domain-containing protein n=1 Tax=Paenibacillus albicereus TaxID=2726185 RepID=A0A6H2H0P9_9BACL|nr:SIS domain-containing protein [Paenibacillus albicereus]QJC53264.1 SIS domain-containing protein [Paenibacillus albicereus]
MSYFIESYFHAVSSSLDSVNAERVHRLAGAIVGVWKQRGTIYIMGNGGSASTASHFACDLSKLTIAGGRPRVKAVSLTDNAAILTAWANDSHYEDIFIHQLIPFLEPRDMVIAISASGNSGNVVKALGYAAEAGAATASLSGFQGGAVSRMTDYPIITFSDSMQVIEDSHSLLCHGMALEVCQLMERVEEDRRLAVGKGGIA